MTEERFDAVVVGGGPSGATAAYALAESGARTLILEKQTVPRHKTCGGGIVARVDRALGFPLDAVVETVCNRVTLAFGADSPVLRLEHDSPLISMTMRDRLDAYLLAQAVARGAELRDGCGFLGLERRRDRLVVSTATGRISAGFVIGCDGARSATARAAGWVKSVPCIPACEWEVRVADRELERFLGNARFDFGAVAGGYAWTFPKEDHLSIGIGRARPGPFRGPALTRAYLASLELKAVHSIQRRGYVIPMRPRPGGAVRDRVFLAGDAAGLVDPVTWEGISYAVMSGQLVGRSLTAAEFDPAIAQREYAVQLDRTILRDIRLGRWLAAILYQQPRLRRWLFRRFGPSLGRAMMRVVCGQTTYSALLSDPRHYGRLVRAW